MGTPDISNIMAISSLFGVSIDELLSGEKTQSKQDGYLFESVTDYDIDRPKRYDMKLGGAKGISIIGYAGEKIKVRLVSNQISGLQKDFKLRIDDVRDRIDIDVSRKNGITEKMAKDALVMFIFLPLNYIRHIELVVNAEYLELTNLECEQIEMDAKIRRLLLDRVVGEVEVNCSLDMDVECHTLQGRVELNQISATSKITLPKECRFRKVMKGIGNSVTFEKDGKPCDDFSDGEADNIIELNGMKSELVISVTERGF